MPSRPELLPRLLEAWFELDECEPGQLVSLSEAFDLLVLEALAVHPTVSRYELLAALKDRYKQYRADRFAKAKRIGKAP